jgi:histidyl-tRNA synthetase
VDQLSRLLELGHHGPSGRRLQVDPSLARGLSYYTGPIFEVQVADLAGSLGGGGRYDNLIGMFLGKKVPAVGFSLGLERILVVMEERRMFPDLSSAAPVMVFQLEEATLTDALSVATELRASGVAVELYPNVDKLGKQFQYAELRGARVALFIGSREREAGEVALKVLSTQQQSSIKRGAVVGAVAEALSSSAPPHPEGPFKPKRRFIR